MTCGGRSGTVQLWGVQTDRSRTFKVNTESVLNFISSLMFSPDGESLAIANNDESFSILDLQTGKHRLIPSDVTVRPPILRFKHVVFSPIGGKLASADGNTIRIWDAQTGNQLQTIIVEGEGLNRFVFSPDGKMIASSGRDSFVRLYDVHTGNQFQNMKGHTGTVNCVAFSPDGGTIVSAGDDSTLRLWNVQSGEQSGIMNGHTGLIYNVVFSPDGKTIASASLDKTIRLWNVDTRASLLTLGEHPSAVTALAFSPDGRTIAGACGGVVLLWNLIFQQ